MPNALPVFIPCGALNMRRMQVCSESPAVAGAAAATEPPIFLRGGAEYGLCMSVYVRREAEKGSGAAASLTDDNAADGVKC